jgi:hypothetical protein
LNDYIRDLRKQKGCELFIVTPHITVGNGYEWTDKEKTAFELNTVIETLSNNELKIELRKFFKDMLIKTDEQSVNKPKCSIFSKRNKIDTRIDKFDKIVHRFNENATAVNNIRSLIQTFLALLNMQ